MADRTLIIKNFAILLSQGYGKTPRTPETQDACLEGWKMVFDEISDDEFNAACRAFLMSKESFWPTPGKLLSFAPSEQQAAVLEQDGDGAFGEVRRLLLRWGRYEAAGQLYDRETDTWDLDDDPIVNAAKNRALQAVTAQAIFDTDGDDLIGMRAHFRRTYEATFRRQRLAGVPTSHQIEARNVLRLPQPGDGYRGGSER